MTQCTYSQVKIWRVSRYSIINQSHWASCFLNKSALLEVAQKFNFTLDFSGFDEIYKAWYTQNTILQTQDAVKKYQNGDASIELDILQQAYVDANKS